MRPVNLALLGTAIGLALGCSQSSSIAASDGAISIQQQSSRNVQLRSLVVCQDATGLRIDGDLVRLAGFRRQHMGHLDIAVSGPDGRILAAKSIADSWFTGQSAQPFRARIAVGPPQGSTVRVMFHESPASCPPDSPRQFEALWQRSHATSASHK